MHAHFCVCVCVRACVCMCMLGKRGAGFSGPMLSANCVCSGPVFSPMPQHGAQLHKTNSLPVSIPLPGQTASPPPVKVPKGIRSNRLRKQGSSAATALARKNVGHSPAKALGVKRNGGTSRVVKTSNIVQEKFIKVGRCQKGGYVTALVASQPLRNFKDQLGTCIPYTNTRTVMMTMICRISTSRRLASITALLADEQHDFALNSISNFECGEHLAVARFAC